MDNVEYLMKNVRQLLENEDSETLRTVFNLFTLEDAESQERFLADLAKAISNAMRQICRKELNTWAKKAAFGWKSALGTEFVMITTLLQLFIVIKNDKPD